MTPVSPPPAAPDSVADLEQLPALVSPADVATREGAPFDPDHLADASAAVRGECGWHIAPRRVHHQVLVSGPPNGQRLVLPSLAVREVHTIVEVESGRAVTGWRSANAGTLVRAGGWPPGEDNLLVTMSHGWDRCPADLIGVLVDRARTLVDPAPPGVRSETSGAVTTAWDPSPAAWSPAAAGVLSRYRV